MKLKTILKVILFTFLILIAGCSTNEVKLPVNAKDDVLSLENYNRPEDFFINDKNHFSSFLDKYWERIELTDKKPKEYYLSRFQEKFLKKPFIEWAHDSMKRFNESGLEFYSGKLFSFYYVNRGKEKTLIYSHGNVSPLMYWADFAISYLDYFKDYNVVFVHSTRINNSQETYSADELNKIFSEDTKSFFEKVGFTKTQNYFNIVCHSALFTYGFFKDQPGLYKQIIYYAPMIKKDNNDIVQDLEKVIDPSLKFDEFHTIYYLYSLSTPKSSRSFPIPVTARAFNIDMEKNLTTLYFKGLDISGFKNKYLIYAQNETMLAPGSYSIQDFSKNQIKMLPNMSHHDYFSVKDRYNTYFEALSDAIKTVK